MGRRRLQPLSENEAAEWPIWAHGDHTHPRSYGMMAQSMPWNIQIFIQFA
jgi:hypothetical protein